MFLMRVRPFRPTPPPLVRRIALVAALALPAGCDALGPGFNYDVRPSILEAGPEDAPQVTVPAQVRAGEEFTVAVVTYGDGCSDRGNTESAAQRARVDVYPFDVYPKGENVACTRELRLHRHEVVVRLEQPGTGTVRVHGRRLPGGEAVTATRTLTVTAS